MTSDNDKDIKLETIDDLRKDDKIKAGVKALAKKPYRKNSAKYKANSQ